MKITIYAHFVTGVPHEHWQSVAEHLVEVARRAMDMAAVFGCGELTCKTVGQFSFDPL